MGLFKNGVPYRYYRNIQRRISNFAAIYETLEKISISIQMQLSTKLLVCIFKKGHLHGATFGIPFTTNF
jgi:hypothetical protein